MVKEKYFKKLQECRSWLADARYVDQHSDLAAGESMIVDTWFDYFINNVKGNTIRPNTRRNYFDRYNRNIKECIGRMNLSDVKPIHCQDILDRMALGYTDSTISQCRTTLYTLFEAAVENDLIPRNPVKKSVKIPECKRLLCWQRDKNKELKVVSKEFSDCVFLCRKGESTKNSAYDSSLFKLCDKAGIPRFSMHVLKHTYATRCIEAGMRPKTLQMLLGHSNIGITMNLYVHVTDDEKKKEVERVENMLNVG